MVKIQAVMWAQPDEMTDFNRKDSKKMEQDEMLSRQERKTKRSIFSIKTPIPSHWCVGRRTKSRKRLRTIEERLWTSVDEIGEIV